MGEKNSNNSKAKANNNWSVRPAELSLPYPPLLPRVMALTFNKKSLCLTLVCVWLLATSVHILCLSVVGALHHHSLMHIYSCLFGWYR
jgi:hypothetical protein